MCCIHIYNPKNILSILYWIWEEIFSSKRRLTHYYVSHTSIVLKKFMNRLRIIVVD
jgi:hypothetical protein